MNEKRMISNVKVKYYKNVIFNQEFVNFLVSRKISKGNLKIIKAKFCNDASEIKPKMVYSWQ